MHYDFRIITSTSVKKNIHRSSISNRGENLDPANSKVAFWQGVHEIGIFGSCMRQEFQMIVPSSLNNEIFIRDYFILRIQVLQLVTDVVSLLGGGLEWCIGQKSEKIHLHCFQ